MHTQPAHTRIAGFTMVELIIVMVVLGILGAMGAEFISQAFRGFHQTDTRMEIYEEGKTALVRMEREIHIALPNAVAVSVAGDAISFGVIDENAMSTVFGQYIEPSPTGGTTITDPLAPLPAGTLISIYNTGWDNFADSSRVYSVASVSGNQMTLGETIGPASPHGRYYAVRNEVVRFRVDASGTLFRETATVSATTALGAFGSPQPMAQNVVQSNGLPYFTYIPGTSTRNSVVAIHFAIARNGETVPFHKEVQVRNVP